MLTETLKQTEIKFNDDSVMIYLLSDKNASVELCGRSMIDWVKNAVNEFPYIEFNYDGSDLQNFLKGKLVNAKYSIILFSNTPLITIPSVLKIVDYIKIKQVKACKFNGGFAFNTEYLKTAKEVQFDSFLPLETEDFLVVDTLEKLKIAKKLLQDRIIQQHMANGVEFVGNSVVDASVKIDKDVIVFPNNILRGSTFVGGKTILKEGNVIETSSIGADCCIMSSNILNSSVEDNVYILSNCYIEKSTIRKNSYIGSNLRIEKRTIRAGSKLKES